MFETLGERLHQAFRVLAGTHKITEENIQDILSQIRSALLDADVALSAIEPLLAKVQREALGTVLLPKMNPEQMFSKLVKDAIVETLGQEKADLDLNAQPPAVILMAGLQGSGKTTTAAKLARLLSTRDKKRVLLVSTDVYRPAAIDQLRLLAEAIHVDIFPSSPEQSPEAIAQAAWDHARRQMYDVLIVDTAGRLHVDEAMMKEISGLAKALNPIEILFVCDAMLGQSAAQTAKVFHEALPITGVVLTKQDSDTRAGAALSIRALCGTPIKFIGTGESVTASPMTLEPFYPERLASQILGKGDLQTLVEQAEQVFEKKQTKRISKKIEKGGFDLEDFREQIAGMGRLGGVQSILSKLPGVGGAISGMREQSQSMESKLAKVVAIIDSMTPKERRFPHIIDVSRKKRIARGSGTEPQDVSRTLSQFKKMQLMIRKVKSPSKLKSMLGQMPIDLKDLM